VYARCRRANDVTCVLQFPSDEEVHVKDVRGNMQRFRFDKVYIPSTTQEQVQPLQLFVTHHSIFARSNINIVVSVGEKFSQLTTIATHQLFCLFL